MAVRLHQIAAMLARFRIPFSLRELLTRTARRLQAGNALGLAAQLGFYFFLALFPALLFGVALAGLLPAENLVGRVVSMLEGIAPQEVIAIIREQLTEISESGAGGIMTFGVVAALWSSSTAMVAIIAALNGAYRVEDSRPWWKQRLTAILLTIGVAFFILVSIALVLAGPQLAGFVAERVGFGAVFEWAWRILQWPLVFALVATAFGLIYYFAPNVDQGFVWLTPGSIAATILWFAGSLGFRFYVVNFGEYNATYGAIGGVMILMLWLYLTGLVIIAGAEMNAEIEHASPQGKAAGEKAGPEAAGPHAARGPEPRPGRGTPEIPGRRRFALDAVARTGLVLAAAMAALLGRRNDRR